MTPTEKPTPAEHLTSFITNRFSVPPKGIFEGAPDIPYFTVDQRYQGQNLPPYTIS